MINNSWRRSVMDEQTYRGGDINSDHILLCTRIQLKLRAVKKVQRHRKFAVYKLKEAEVEEAVRLELRNRLSALENIDDENKIEKKLEKIMD
jgi:hypothetical protein